MSGSFLNNTVNVCTHFFKEGALLAQNAGASAIATVKPGVLTLAEKISENFMKALPHIKQVADSLTTVISYLSIPLSIVVVIKLYNTMQNQSFPTRCLLFAYQALVVANVALDILILMTAPVARPASLSLLSASVGLALGIGYTAGAN